MSIIDPTDVDELAAFYTYLAEAEFDGYCDLYATLAREIVADRELLEVLAGLAPSTKIVPVLTFAAVHHLLLAEPDQPLARIYATGEGDPWPPFRDLLTTRLDDIAHLMAVRSVQTNEVGRAAVIAPALAAVHERFGRPLALVEIGTSAGLNLLLDRFGYRYDLPDGTTVRRGDLASPVQLACEVRGDLLPSLPPTLPPMASRTGIDLHPVDVHEAEERRWLEACVWPRVPDRPERLRAAIELARAERPELRTGDALELLDPTIATIDEDAVPVVLSTWVLGYFSRESRAALGELLDGIGAERDLAFVSGEYPSIAPFVAKPERVAHGTDGGGASLVGLSSWQGGGRRSDPVAWIHAHGRWIDWLDAETAG